MTTIEDLAGHFGQYGGRFVPEALIGALEELDAARIKAQTDPTFIAELLNFTVHIPADRASSPKQSASLNIAVALEFF
jgi:tryptophan synthase beta subunit